jgi:hypothetical protein
MGYPPSEIMTANEENFKVYFDPCLWIAFKSVHFFQILLHVFDMKTHMILRQAGDPPGQGLGARPGVCL